MRILSMRRVLTAAVVSIPVLWIGCSNSEVPAVASCSSDSDCPGGRCEGGRCAPVPDASTENPDGSVDVPDGSTDPADASVDAPDAAADKPDGSVEEPDGSVVCTPSARVESTCDDGLDQDCDGLVDCADFDCVDKTEIGRAHV